MSPDPAREPNGAPEGGTADGRRQTADGPRVLVLTTVHHPDDTRIREKLIRTLVGAGFDVRYATGAPGPSDPEGLTWVPLRGGRLRRNLAAWRLGLFTRYRVLSLHDPETLPLGIVVRLLRRRRVVFDVHEDIPAQIRTKPWLPGALRRPVAWLAHRLLRLAERLHPVTLAEAGYRRLFRREHPVFANFLDRKRLPDVAGDRRGIAVYVGDITEARGLRDAVAAAGVADIPLHLVGPVSDRERAALEEVAEAASVDVVFHGRLAHGAAMEVLAEASVALSPLHDLPNYRHATPTKVLEYLAMGVPVVASDLPGTREALDGLDAVWLVPPGDVPAMTDALGEAATPGSAESAAAQAPDVRSRFRWPTHEVSAFYHDLAAH